DPVRTVDQLARRESFFRWRESINVALSLALRAGERGADCFDSRKAAMFDDRNRTVRPPTQTLALFAFAALIGLVREAAADDAALRTSLVRVIDLDVGQSQVVELCNGRKVSVKLLDLKETRDSVRNAVRRAEVTVEVDGRRAQLVSANYNLPTKLGDVRIDCSMTKGIYENTNADSWALVKDARLRLWPADSPLIEPDTFIYPVNQRWFASLTHMSNEPVYADGVEPPAVRKIYYHSGEDIGGAENMV